MVDEPLLRNTARTSNTVAVSKEKDAAGPDAECHQASEYYLLPQLGAAAGHEENDADAKLPTRHHRIEQKHAAARARHHAGAPDRRHRHSSAACTAPT